MARLSFSPAIPGGAARGTRPLPCRHGQAALPFALVEDTMLNISGIWAWPLPSMLTHKPFARHHSFGPNDECTELLLVPETEVAAFVQAHGKKSSVSHAQLLWAYGLAPSPSAGCPPMAPFGHCSLCGFMWPMACKSHVERLFREERTCRTTPISLSGRSHRPGRSPPPGRTGRAFLCRFWKPTPMQAAWQPAFKDSQGSPGRWRPRGLFPLRLFSTPCWRPAGRPIPEHLRVAGVRIANTWVPNPFQKTFRHLPSELDLECVKALLPGPHRRPDGFHPRPISGSGSNHIFGEGIARLFMLPYNFKVWATPTGNLMGYKWIRRTGDVVTWSGC